LFTKNTYTYIDNRFFVNHCCEQSRSTYINHSLCIWKKKSNIGGRKTGKEGKGREGGKGQRAGQVLPFSKNCQVEFFLLSSLCDNYDSAKDYHNTPSNLGKFKNAEKPNNFLNK